METGEPNPVTMGAAVGGTKAPLTRTVWARREGTRSSAASSPAVVRFILPIMHQAGLAGMGHWAHLGPCPCP